MLPVIIGIGALLLASSCSREKEPEDSNPKPNPPPPPPKRQMPLLRFEPEVCDPGRAIPAGWPVKYAHHEFCRLHTLLTGGKCEVTPNGVQLSETQSPNSLFALAPDMEAQNNYSLVQRTPKLVDKLSQLEGLPLYLADGEKCQFDNLVDLQNLVAAYSLLLFTAQSKKWQELFQKGSMGCVMQSATVHYHGSHTHHIEDREVQHQKQETHQLLITPGHLTQDYRDNNPGFPELPWDTPVSDCIKVR